jgi:mono/diheme cytochrome c family protein
MRRTSAERVRRRFGAALVLALAAGIGWFFSPGLPVLWGPSASAAVRAEGRTLFEHEWQPNDPLAHGDGLGPLFNAKSCAACHSQGGVGGSGSNQFNVTSFEILPTHRDPGVHTGTVHAFATDAASKESPGLLHRTFPVEKGGVEVQVPGHCSYTTRRADFDPVRTRPVNTPALFGDGWIDRISPKAIQHNLLKQLVVNSAQEYQFVFSAVPAGRVHVLPDGRVGKFGWKAQFATLEEFVAAACSNELGLGTPYTEQAKPFHKADAAKVDPDLDRGQFKALVAFVDTLPKPVEVLPDDPAGRAAAVHGKELFTKVGCAVCHTPDLGGVNGVYSDFLLHTLDDGTGTPGSDPYAPLPDVPFPADEAKPSEWKTPPLWGVADSAPYMHDGAAPTLKAAILRHNGDGKAVTEAYRKLSGADQEAVLAFLRTLKAPPEAAPVAVAAKR